MSQKNAKKSSRRKYHNVTSLKIDVIGKYYYIRKNNLTENNNNNNNWKSSKISKSVTENMNVSLNWRKQNMGREYFSFVRLSSNRREDKCSPAHFEIHSILSSEKSYLIQSNHTAKNTGIQGFPRKDILPNKIFVLGWWWQELKGF